MSVLPTLTVFLWLALRRENFLGGGCDASSLMHFEKVKFSNFLESITFEGFDVGGSGLFCFSLGLCP